MLECLSRSTDVCLSSAPSNQEENSQSKAKGKQTSPPASKIRKRRGFFERSGVKVSAHRSVFQSVLNAFLHSCEVFCGSQMYLSLSGRSSGWRSLVPSVSSVRFTARIWPPIWRVNSTKITSSFWPVSYQSPPLTFCRYRCFTLISNFFV